MQELYFEEFISIILYLKFKLSNEKTAFVPRDSVIFYGISLKFAISQSSVGYYSIPRSRATRGHHALKQYGVRELLFVLISYRTTEDLLSKPKISTRICYIQLSKGYLLKYFKEKTSKTQV